MKTNPVKTENEFIKILRIACNMPSSFIRNKPKTKTEIEQMISSLSEFCREKGVTMKNIAIAHAQIWVLRGEAKASDFSDISPQLAKVLKTTEKWLQGKVYDEAMFE